MLRVFLGTLSLIVLSACATSPLVAAPFGARSCDDVDKFTAFRLNQLRNIVTDTSTDGADNRALWKLPAALASEVVLVSDTTVCASALAAYNARRAPEYRTDRVRVFKVRDVYVVEPPFSSNSEDDSDVWVFNATFTQALARLAG